MLKVWWFRIKVSASEVYFKFRRWYCTHRLPLHNRWVTRVMRREYGITKEMFQ